MMPTLPPIVMLLIPPPPFPAQLQLIVWSGAPFHWPPHQRHVRLRLTNHAPAVMHITLVVYPCASFHSSIDLHQNLFSAKVPSMIQYLANLTQLDISQNRFVGDLSMFSKLPSLTFLNVSYNQLTGSALLAPRGNLT